MCLALPVDVIQTELMEKEGGKVCEYCKREMPKKDRKQKKSKDQKKQIVPEEICYEHGENLDEDFVSITISIRPIIRIPSQQSAKQWWSKYDRKK